MGAAFSSFGLSRAGAHLWGHADLNTKKALKPVKLPACPAGSVLSVGFIILSLCFTTVRWQSDLTHSNVGIVVMPLAPTNENTALAFFVFFR